MAYILSDERCQTYIVFFICLNMIYFFSMWQRVVSVSWYRRIGHQKALKLRYRLISAATYNVRLYKHNIGNTDSHLRVELVFFSLIDGGALALPYSRITYIFASDIMAKKIIKNDSI